MKSYTEEKLSSPTPSVSVVLPTFNRSKQLISAAKSVLNQTFEDLELIIVDDGSTEDIEYATKCLTDSRVRLIKHNTNMGAAAARNTGISVARGEFLAFQDSDDLWLPEKLEIQTKLLNGCSDDVATIVGGRILYGRDSKRLFGPGKVTYIPNPSNLQINSLSETKSQLTHSILSLQASLSRRLLILEVGGFDETLRANEDWDLSIRISETFRMLQHIDPVAISFLSSDSISLHKTRNAAATLRIFQKYKNSLKNNGNQYSEALYIGSRHLSKIGKKRSSRKLLIKSIKNNPLIFFKVLEALLRHFKRMLERARIKDK